MRQRILAALLLLNVTIAAMSYAIGANPILGLAILYVILFVLLIASIFLICIVSGIAQGGRPLRRDAAIDTQQCGAQPSKVLVETHAFSSCVEIPSNVVVLRGVMASGNDVSGDHFPPTIVKLLKELEHRELAA